MKPRNEKAPAATEAIPNETGRQIVANYLPDRKEYETARSIAELRRQKLTRAHRAEDGRVTFLVTGPTGGTRALSHWDDLVAYLSSLGNTR
jgi:hypothetical protein